MYLVVGEPVRDDTSALVQPESQGTADGCTLLWAYVEHALPDARQVTQVEDVVELGWSGQHLSLQ